MEDTTKTEAEATAQALTGMAGVLAAAAAAWIGGLVPATDIDHAVHKTMSREWATQALALESESPGVLPERVLSLATKIEWASNATPEELAVRSTELLAELHTKVGSLVKTEPHLNHGYL